MRISWIGPFDGYGAYPIINRHLTAALEARGHTVLRNLHSDSGGKPAVLVSCQYPPQAPTMKHDVNISYSTWEFTQVPKVFIAAFEAFDLNVAMCQWVKENYEAAMQDFTSAYIHLGVSDYWFTRDGHDIKWDRERVKRAFWLGGTDKRHGLDIALNVAKHLPDGYELVVYQYPNYPQANLAGARNVIDISQPDSPHLEIAHMYRSVDCLLHSARAVGFSLPVLEAMAVGLPIVTLPLPPVMEYCPTPYVAPSRYLSPRDDYHHVHSEVIADWYIPDNIHDMVDLVVKACNAERPTPVLRSWGDVAKEWEELLEAWQ